jgi:hypothetical protein
LSEKNKIRKKSVDAIARIILNTNTTLLNIITQISLYLNINVFINILAAKKSIINLYLKEYTHSYKGEIVKIEVDTLNDSVDEIKKTITMLQEIVEKRTGVTPTGQRIPLRPSEFKQSEPKIIFEDIMAKPSKSTPIPVPREKLEVKKRKVLKQDEHAEKEEEEDEDRNLPKIQYKDFW